MKLLSKGRSRKETIPSELWVVLTDHWCGFPVKSGDIIVNDNTPSDQNHLRASTAFGWARKADNLDLLLYWGKHDS
jgi:hypothetical protein